jgi:protein-disulfide isomerase
MNMRALVVLVAGMSVNCSQSSWSQPTPTETVAQPDTIKPAGVASQPAPAAESPVEKAAKHADAPHECGQCKDGSDPVLDPTKRETVGEDGLILGDRAGAHSIVVFTDLECPFCAKLHTYLASFLEKHPTGYKVVLRHRPLPFHEQAKPLALAAVVAQQHGRGEAFVNAVFANQRKDREHLLETATRAAGLDLAAVKRDSESSSVTSVVDKDSAEADALGVRGTPTFFVDGQRVTGARADLEKVITDAQK